MKERFEMAEREMKEGVRNGKQRVESASRTMNHDDAAGREELE